MYKRLFTTLAATTIALAFMPGAVGIGLAATPTAPFTQCPAIGADTSCGLLLVINPDGTVTALNDPGQGPYDGVEDTLIGVQNNSAVSIPSLTLNSSTGTGAFLFDGDGICSGAFSGTPPGCPSPGPTVSGYEGPNTTLTPIDSDNGTVTFTGGLAAGASAYFSLEEHITAQNLIIIPPNQPPVCSSATVDPKTLWPPDHTLRNVTISGVTDPDPGDTVTINVTGVTQDESVNGLGDGDTGPDAVTTPNSNVVKVRAERSGTADGRVYAITFTGTDAGGLTCTGTANVSVPHDQKPGHSAVNSGQNFDSLVP